MASLTFLIPVPEGKAEHFRQVAQQALNERRPDHHKSRQSHGYDKEKAWLHKTPYGDMLVVYLEGNVPEANETFVTSQEPHDVWFREQLLGSLGLDLSKGIPPEGELVFDYEA